MNDLDFHIKIALDELQAGCDVGFFEDSLSLLRLQKQLGRNEIGGFAGIGDALQLFHLVFGQALLRVVEPFEEGLQECSSESFGAEFIFRLDFFDIIHISGQETVAAGDLQEFHAGYSFDEHADEASRHLEHLCHFDDSADVVKVVFLRYFHAGILLHGHDEVSFAFPCKAHGFDGFFSSDVQIDGHAGINDYISQRHYREVERLISVLYFIHR